MLLRDHLNADGRQIIDAVFQPTASDPGAPVNGQFWYNTTTHLYKGRANGATITFGTAAGIANVVEDATPQLGGQLDVNGQSIGDGTRILIAFVEDGGAVNYLEIENEETGNGPILRATGADVNVDLHLQTKGSGEVVVTGDLAVTGTVDGRDVASDGTKLDLITGTNTGDEVQATTTTAGIGETATQTEANTGTDIARFITPSTLANFNPSVAAAWFLDEDTMSTDSATAVPSQQSVKAYVASQIAGVSRYQGGYNAATNNPDLDTAPSGVLQGDQYTVTAAGSFFTEAVEVGDLLISEQDDPAVLADWTIVNRNLDAASETVAGISEKATQAEVNTGTDTDRFITPATLRGTDVARKHVELIGNGADTDLVVTHNLGTKDITVSVREVASDEQVLTTVEATSTNTATITFDSAPASNAYSVTVVG